MGKVIKLKDIKNLIEHNGDFLTPEEFAKLMGVTGDFELKLHGEDSDHWFANAMTRLDNKDQ